MILTSFLFPGQGIIVVLKNGTNIPKDATKLIQNEQSWNIIKIDKLEFSNKDYLVLKYKKHMKLPENAKAQII